MTTDNDMIRRGDVLDAMCKGPRTVQERINAIRAITAQPDPRDEVIAALVDALEGIKNMKASTSGSTNVQSIWDTVEIARAALAAAKAVRP